MSRFLCLVVCLAFVGCQRYEGTNNKAGYENEKGVGFLEKEEFESAISCFTEAIRLDPSLATVYRNRGLAYNELGKFDEAIRDYSEAIRLDPKNAVAYFERSICYRKKGDSEKARADLEKAKQLGYTPPTQK